MPLNRVRQHVLVPNMEGGFLLLLLLFSLFALEDAHRVQQDFHKPTESPFTGRAVTNRVAFCGQ